MDEGFDPLLSDVTSVTNVSKSKTSIWPEVFVGAVATGANGGWFVESTVILW